MTDKGTSRITINATITALRFFYDVTVGNRNIVVKLCTETDEFIWRCLIHGLPCGFHRIRHYGLLANARWAENIGLARALLIDQADGKDNQKGISENTK
ncbi:MAG: hypothetical protein ACI8P9_005560 [Parasphingorhabdus sp.]